MPSTRPSRHRRSLRRAAAACAVALAHLGLLFLASTLLPPEQTTVVEPPHESFAVASIAPERASPSRPAEPPKQRKRKDKHAPAEAPAVAGAPPAAAGAGPGVRAGAGGQGARDLADPWAVQEALKGSVGCSLEDLKLRPDQRDHCDERAARLAKKGKKIGPAADDPKRAAELAADEDYVRRFNQWKASDSGTHNGSDWWDSRGAVGAPKPKRNPTPPPPDIPE